MTARGWIVAILALALAAVSVWRLESARSGITLDQMQIGDTPVTRYSDGTEDGPPVVIAHGFAGSRQMMQAYALTLARAGHIVYAFDFLGHGRHTTPMSGDVTAIDGTTRLLIEQTQRVMAAALTETGHTGRVPLLGHSMASDVLIRLALEDDRAGALVLLSPFSQAVTADAPDTMLLISGQWEPGLRAFAVDALRLADPMAEEGQIVQRDGLRRGAMVAPRVEHVAILVSPEGQRLARDWIGHAALPIAQVPLTGPWIVGLLAAIVALAWPVSLMLPASAQRPVAVPVLTRVLAVALPALLAPGLAIWLNPGTLPVLVADHLALHLLLYGALQLGILWRAGVTPGPVAPIALAVLVVWGIAVFGGALDRYAANFWPTGSRFGIIAVMALGTVPFMLGDLVLTQRIAGGALARVLARLGFFASLGLAVALDLEGLFFLLIVAPVIVLFFLVFGLMGRWVARRAGAASAGIGLGLVLAWALGVSFPLFAVG